MRAQAVCFNSSSSITNGSQQTSPTSAAEAELREIEQPQSEGASWSWRCFGQGEPIANGLCRLTWLGRPAPAEDGSSDDGRSMSNSSMYSNVAALQQSPEIDVCLSSMTNDWMPAVRCAGGCAKKSIGVTWCVVCPYKTDCPSCPTFSFQQALLSTNLLL